MLAANAADIGNIVRRRRTKASLSQGELADKIGVSRKWIADLEKGHPRAQLQLVLDVLNALDALVDVIDAPSEESVAGTHAGAAMGSMPNVAALTAPSQDLERVLESMRLSDEALRQIQGAARLTSRNNDGDDA